GGGLGGGMGGGGAGGGTGGGGGGGTGGGGPSCAGGCSGATPVCDPQSNTCVACIDNTTCSGATPICNTSTKRCVACTGNVHCGGSAPYCDTSTNACVTCTSTMGCGGATSVCDTSVPQGQCVQCLANSNCGGMTPVCNLANKTCVRCTTGQGCSGATPVCDTTVPGGVCVACTANSHCGGATPWCDTSTRQCVQCLSNANCGGTTPLCNTATRTCVTCTATAGCSGATPVCDTTVPGGQCVQCTSNSNCGGTAPICNTTTKQCVRCTPTAGCSTPTPVCDTSVAGGQCVGCLTNSNCGGATPVCDTTARQCVRCTATAGCSGATPVCDTSIPGGACVGCLSNANCGGATPICNTTTRACVTCTATAGCAAPTPVCDTSVTNGQCVGCLSNANCGGTTPICNTTTRQCVRCTATAGCLQPTPVCDTSVAGGQCVGCLSNLNCAAPTPICNTTTRNCVQCTSSAHCSGGTPVCDTASGSCVQCLSNANCSGMRPLCNTTSRQCVQCLSSANCTAPTAQCETTAGNCVQCLSNANCMNPTPVCTANACGACTDTPQCSPGASCAMGSCVANPESCAMPQVIPLMTGQTMVNFPADLRRATNDVDGTCSASGPELVFQLNLPAAQDVTISLAKAAGQGTSDGVLYVRTSPCASGTELGCEDSTFSDGVETLTLYNQSGTLFIFAEAYTSTYAVLYDVSVVLSAPTPPPANESCSAPQALTFSGNAATATGSLVSAANDNGATDAAPTCSAEARTTGRDVVYSFTTTAAQDVEVTVTPGGGAFTPVVYLRTLANCAVGTTMAELGCSLGSTSGVTQRFTNLPAGSYALWVDSTAAVNASFSLGVQLLPPTLPPANDTCTAPEVLMLSSNLASTTGQTAAAANDYSAACSTGSATLGDTVYSLVVPGTVNTPVSFVVAPTLASFVPSLYAGTACPVSAPLACAAGTTATQRRPVGVLLPSQAPGTVFAVVDGQAGNGYYRLDARVGAPPNDTCATAVPIGLSTVVVDASALETTQLSTNDFTAMGGFTTRYNGKDLVYSFTPATTGSFTVTVTPSPTFDPSITVLSGGCGPSFYLDSEDTGASGTPDSVTFSGAAGQTYWFVVDGYGSGASNEGFFRLEVR
ncbi:MAG: hypothetical protein AB1938_28470, partial [Myxococcota bacterium]